MSKQESYLSIATYKGSKRRLLPILLNLIDDVKHDVYVEPFGGMAVVLLNKIPVKRNVYNDTLFHNFWVLTALSNDDIYPRFIDGLLDWQDYSEDGFFKLTDEYISLCEMYLQRVTSLESTVEHMYIQKTFQAYLDMFAGKKIDGVALNDNLVLESIDFDMDVFRRALYLYGEHNDLMSKLAINALLLQTMSYQADITRHRFRKSDVHKRLQERILCEFDLIHEKLSGNLEVYCCDAISLIKKLSLLYRDNERVLIYADPPYVNTDGYNKGAEDGKTVNERLVKMLVETSNHWRVAISGYDNAVLDDLNSYGFDKLVLQTQVNSLKRDINNNNEDVEEILWVNF